MGRIPGSGRTSCCLCAHTAQGHAVELALKLPPRRGAAITRLNKLCLSASNYAVPSASEPTAMITKQQRKALLFIEAEMARTGGVAPTVRQIADHLHYRSTTMASPVHQSASASTTTL